MATTSTPVDRLAQAVNAAAQMQIDRQVLHVSALRTAIGAHTFATALEHSRSMALAAAVDAVSTFLTHVVDMELSEGQGDLLGAEPDEVDGLGELAHLRRLGTLFEFGRDVCAVGDVRPRFFESLTTRLHNSSPLVGSVEEAPSPVTGGVTVGSVTPDVPTVGDLADTPAPSPAEPVSAGDPVGGDADGPSSPTAATTRDDQTDYWQYGGYSPSGDAWLCPRDDCEFGVAGLLAPSCTDDGCDIDPVREHLYQHSLQDEYERITDEAAGGDAYGTLRPSDLSALVAVIREGFESIVDLFDSPAVVSPASSGAFPTTGTRGCGTAPEVAR